jgi:chromosome segregation ATPase
MMQDPRTAEATAIRLAELSHEIDQLESSRAALLDRVDDLRAMLVAAGNRTTSMRANVDMLCEHITNTVLALAELRALENELRAASRALTDEGQETSRLGFESDSLSDALDEAEEEMEKLSTILIDGRARPPRGH